MQEELDDCGARLGQELLEVGDELVPAGPHIAWHQLVDADDEYLFVVRSVENADLALPGDALVHTPQEVVGLFLRGWHLEARYLAALRVESGHHLPDRAVLA